jgi:hypothetical protein
MIEWFNGPSSKLHPASPSTVAPVSYQNEYVLSTERFIIDSVPQLEMAAQLTLLKSQSLACDNNEVGGGESNRDIV